jgi:hypothetical protein
VEARLRGRPGTGWDAAGLMNAPLDHPVSGFPLSDDLLPWVGSGPRHDIGVLGRVERPRSTAADQGWSALTRCNRQAETWDLKAFQSPSQSSGFPLSVAPSSRLAAEWWPRGRGTSLRRALGRGVAPPLPGVHHAADDGIRLGQHVVLPLPRAIKRN